MAFPKDLGIITPTPFVRLGYIWTTSHCSDNGCNKNWGHIRLQWIYKSFINLTRLAVNKNFTWILCNTKGVFFFFSFVNLQVPSFFYRVMPQSVYLAACMILYILLSVNFAHGKSLTLKMIVAMSFCAHSAVHSSHPIHAIAVSLCLAFPT